MVGLCIVGKVLKLGCLFPLAIEQRSILASYIDISQSSIFSCFISSQVKSA